MATRKRSSVRRTVRAGPGEVGDAAAATPYIDQEIVSGDAAGNWTSLTTAMLAGRSVELIPVVQANRVRTIARIWLDYRADASNDPRVTPPVPPLR